MKLLLAMTFVFGSLTVSANDNLLNCAEVLRAKDIPSCTELMSVRVAGRPADVKKGQRWSDESQISDAYDTYVVKGREDICIDKFSEVAKKSGVCGG